MEQWKIHKDRVRCDKSGCPLLAEQEYFAILRLPDCVRLERCQSCFHELQQGGDAMPFHWRIRRAVDGKQQAVLDLNSLRSLFDTLGEVGAEPDSGAEAPPSPPAPQGSEDGGQDAGDAEDAGEVAGGLRYLVALLLIRKRRLKMVDALTPEQEAADLVVVDPKVEGMEPVALHAPSLDPERLAGLREELTAAIGG